MLANLHIRAYVFLQMLGTPYEAKSPYLKHARRLPEVLAAIQVMGAHRIDSLPPEKWQERLRKPESADSWEQLFEDHPEFFQRRSDSTDEEKNRRWVLTWRLAFDSRYAADEGKEYSLDEARPYLKIEAGQPGHKDFSRRPLTAEEMATLLKAAIQLQTRATAFEERNRWLLAAAVSFIGAAILAFLGWYLKVPVHGM